MDKRKSFKWGCIIFVIFTLFLAGCKTEKIEKKQENSKKEETEVKDKEISEQVRTVIETMMTGSNDEFLFARSVIEEGVTQTEEEIQKIHEQNEAVNQKWQDEVGTCFAERRLEEFLSVGPAMKYLQEANTEGVPLKVKEMTLESKNDYMENVSVRYLLGEKEEQTVLSFFKDSGGLLMSVKEESAVTEEQEYEPQRITKEEFMEAYAKEQNLPEEEAVVQLEEEQGSLVRYGIKVEDYDIIYEKRIKDEDVGDGLILTATVFTEILVDKENGEYMSYGIAATGDVWLRGNLEGLSSYSYSSDAYTIQNGNLEVIVNGDARFQTDGNREFTNVDIKKITGNNYQYTISEEIIFTL